MDFWNDKDERYRFKMVDVYNEQIKDLIKIVSDDLYKNGIFDNNDNEIANK